MFVTDSDEGAGEGPARHEFSDMRPADAGRDYHSYGLGYKYGHGNLPAAFALAGLRRLDMTNAWAVSNWQRLDRLLAGTPHLVRSYSTAERPDQRLRVRPARRPGLRPAAWRLGLRPDQRPLPPPSRRRHALLPRPLAAAGARGLSGQERLRQGRALGALRAPGHRLLAGPVAGGSGLHRHLASGASTCIAAQPRRADRCPRRRHPQGLRKPRWGAGGGIAVRMGLGRRTMSNGTVGTSAGLWHGAVRRARLHYRALVSLHGRPE